MKHVGKILALSLATAGCVGQVGTGKSGNGSNPTTQDPAKPGPSPTDPGQPSDPNAPPKDPPPVNVGTCSAMTLAKPRAWRLTSAQIKNTLKDTFGFVPPKVDSFPAEARIDKDESRNGYANRSDNLEISALLADSYFAAGDELGADVVARATNYGIGCAMTDLGSGNCLKGFLTTFGTKMWRRPLTDAEISKFTALYTTSAGQGEGPQGGIKNVVQAMFLSPNFLYRSEIGHTQAAGAVTSLTDYELASSLSYTLWDTAPDATLMDLASQGKLRDQATLVAQAKRMLGVTDRIAPAMNSFMQQWMHIETMLTGPPKDQSVYSMGTPEVAAAVAEGSRLLVNSVIFDQGGDKSFKTLFTANYAFVNAKTAPLYGITGVTGNDFVKKETNGAERRGLLTDAAFMWGHANPDGTHPIERGRFFREEVLCQGVPDPPPTVIVAPAFGDKTLTARERLKIHEAEPACAACHTLIDGFGLAMEQYDGIGRFRKEEVVEGGASKVIDASGSVPLPSDNSTIAFGNFVEMVDKLAEKKDVYSCFASQYIDYSTGRKPGETPKCEQELITDAFVKSGYKVDSLVLAVIGSPSFMARKN
jgi:hypothetical protein